MVSPAMGATLQTFFSRRALIIELFPTLGYPIKPTLICRLSACNCTKKKFKIRIAIDYVILEDNIYFRELP